MIANQRLALTGRRLRPTRPPNGDRRATDKSPLQGRGRETRKDTQSEGICVLGGQKVVGYPSNHRVKFCYSSIPNRVPFIGIRIYFPRASDTAIDFYNATAGHHSLAGSFAPC